MTPDDSIDVSVVIPCLNEAQSIAICIDKAISSFEKANIRGEVVVSDNGSTDQSVEISRSHGARITHAARKGYGHALRQGIQEARGKFIIMGDADDSYDFSEVPRFVEKWREGNDIVMGNRFRGSIKSQAMPWHHRYIGNPVLSGILRIFFHTPIGDSHCGMRGFTKEIYRRMDLRTTGMEFASEFVIKAAKLGVNIAEIPITLWPDKRGRPPHLRSFRDGWRHLRFMLMYAPNWLFMIPGSLLMGIGLATIIWLLPGERILGSVGFDDNTMFLGMIFTLLGAQIIFIGLFAKVFSHTEEFDKSNIGLSRWLKRIKLETGLVVGLILTLAGIAGNLILFMQWRASGYGAFYEIRWMIFSSTLFFLGVQIVFSSFFLSMLGISRDTYIGDKDFQL